MLEGLDGEPTGLAIPCGNHATFRFSPGWYERFAQAWEATRAEPSWKSQCRECGEEYDTFLWGCGSSSRCPERTHWETRRCAETGRKETASTT